MADSDTTDSDSVGKVVSKGRLYRKYDSGKQSKEKMIRYYADPEKKAKLKERIKNYTEAMQAIQAKITKLSEYLEANEHPERTENS